MYPIKKWVGAVFIAASNFFCPLNSGATLDTSHVIADRSSLYISTETSPKIPEGGVGRTVYYPDAAFYSNPQILKLSFEIRRVDEEGNSFNIDRLNFNGLGVRCFIVVGDNGEYWDNVGLLKDFAVDNALYTDEISSPEVNQGALICPYDENGDVVQSLVGYPIRNSNPHFMNGWYKVHSNSEMKVHRIRVTNMPFTISDEQKGLMRYAKDSNPGVPLALSVDCFVYVDYALNVENGCMAVLSFAATNSHCTVYVDGRLKPSRQTFQVGVIEKGAITVPMGCFSWLDLYESDSPSGSWTKVDLSTCVVGHTIGNPSSTPPPEPRTLTVSGLSTEHVNKFYRLATRD